MEIEQSTLPTTEETEEAILAAWQALQNVPSYVEQQAREFATEKTEESAA